MTVHYSFLLCGLIPAFIVRLVMIVYSVYHDKNSSIKYTDIDYQVFSDAARSILSPNDTLNATWIGSPYDRATYRYTPLLALILTPNHLVHPCWGKVLFSLSDLIVGFLLYQLCPNPREKAHHARMVNLVWLLNPFVINISTRGSSESILGVVIIAFLYSAKRSNWDLAAILLGLAVHLKIYPFLYGAAVLARLRTEQRKSTKNNLLTHWIYSINRHQVRFSLISFSTFIILNSIMYSIWGYPFIESSYLYHLKRSDHRHNFSPYFYPIYLRFTQPLHEHSTNLLKNLIKCLQNPLTSFIPQISLSLALGFYYGQRDLTFACFIQTYSFVVFNKVSTSQYFIWYLWFIPTLTKQIKLDLFEFVFVSATWILTQLVWLSNAYKLEFLGQPVFFSVWLSCLFFLIGNSFIIGRLIIGFSKASTYNLNQDSKVTKRELSSSVQTVEQNLYTVK